LASFGSGSLSGWLVLAASVAGGFAVYAMTRAYRLRTVPSWNHTGTSWDFLGSALLLGGLQFTIVSDVLAGGFGVGHGLWFTGFSQNIGLLVALAGFIFEVQAYGMSLFKIVKSGTLFSFSQPVLQGSGLVLWVASTLSRGGTCLEWALLSLAAAGLVVGEIIHRIRFYGAYRSAGL